MTIKTLFLVHLQGLRRHVATSDVDSDFQDASSLSLLKVYVCVAAAPLPQKVLAHRTWITPNTFGGPGSSPFRCSRLNKTRGQLVCCPLVLFKCAVDLDAESCFYHAMHTKR